jgi:hypothetical protein
VLKRIGLLLIVGLLNPLSAMASADESILDEITIRVLDSDNMSINVTDIALPGIDREHKKELPEAAQNANENAAFNAESASENAAEVVESATGNALEAIENAAEAASNAAEIVNSATDNATDAINNAAGNANNAAGNAADAAANGLDNPGQNN